MRLMTQAAVRPTQVVAPREVAGPGQQYSTVVDVAAMRRSHGSPYPRRSPADGARARRRHARTHSVTHVR